MSGRTQKKLQYQNQKNLKAKKEDNNRRPSYLQYSLSKEKKNGGFAWHRPAFIVLTITCHVTFDFYITQDSNLDLETYWISCKRMQEHLRFDQDIYWKVLIFDIFIYDFYLSMFEFKLVFFKKMGFQTICGSLFDSYQN